MSWGCKPENHPAGCGWAARLAYPRMGFEEWWCDTCERAGNTLDTPVVEPDSVPAVCDNGGTTKRPLGGASTPLIQGASPTTEESTGA